MRSRAFGLALALTACGSTTTYRVITGPLGVAQPGGEPRMYFEGAPVPTGYTEVAVVQAVGRGNQADDDHVLEGLRAQAASLGCEAVIRVRVDAGEIQRSAVGVGVRWLHGVPRETSVIPDAATPWTQPASAAPPWATTPR